LAQEPPGQPEARKRIAVLGAGPGGYPAAFLAAEKGFDVTLIDERPNPGGVCLYAGCIPSKALLPAAELLHDARAAEAIGITFDEPNIDLDRLRAWKDGEVVAKMTGVPERAWPVCRRRHDSRRPRW
jgi:dihydrolipoamide dehydrogenase